MVERAGKFNENMDLFMDSDTFYLTGGAAKPSNEYPLINLSFKSDEA